MTTQEQMQRLHDAAVVMPAGFKQAQAQLAVASRVLEYFARFLTLSVVHLSSTTFPRKRDDAPRARMSPLARRRATFLALLWRTACQGRLRRKHERYATTRRCFRASHDGHIPPRPRRVPINAGHSSMRADGGHVRSSEALMPTALAPLHRRRAFMRV